MNRALLSVASALVLFGVMTLGSAVPAAADDDNASSDKLFKELDVNGDGKLTASEIPKEHRKFFERLLRIGDADKDGVLTREEFDRALQQKEEPVTDINKTGGLGLGGGPRGNANVDPKRIFQMLDKNKDGKLTRDEVSKRPRIEALFDRLGKDELTLDDLTAALRKAGGKGKGKGKKRPQPAATKSSSEDSAEEMSGGPGGQMTPAFFKLLDTNHDGLLSKAELSKAAELFDQLDKNQDGFLEPRELMGSRPEGQASAGKTAENGLSEGGTTRTARFRGRQALAQMFKEADTDGDGKLSREEAPPRFKKNFAAIDTNDDGYLELSEVQAWARQHRKKAGAVPESQNPSGEKSAENSGQKSGL